ncbi:hypothetical protein Hanom_Chr15g01413871 [Helianthus anomalus]
MFNISLVSFKSTFLFLYTSTQPKSFQQSVSIIFQPISYPNSMVNVMHTASMLEYGVLHVSISNTVQPRLHISAATP